MSRRVVITGVGPVSAIGTGRDAFSAAIVAGKSGIIVEKDLPSPNPPGSHRYAPVKDLRVEEYLESPKAYLDRSSQFAFAATALALEDASLDPTPDMGIVLGTAFGSLETMTVFFDGFLEKGPRFAKPFLFPHAYANTAISLLAIEYGLKGFHLSLASGFISGAAAVAEGFEQVRNGRSAVVLAGGYEALSPALLHGLRLAGWTGDVAGVDDPGHLAPGEGAAVLVLEDREHALARKARVLGEITGVGLSGDIADALRAAMGTSSTPPVVCAAADGLPEVDKPEDLALHSCFGKAAPAVVRAHKRLFGETFGAGGALEVAAAISLLGAQKATSALVNSVDPGGSAVCLFLTA